MSHWKNPFLKMTSTTLGNVSHYTDGTMGLRVSGEGLRFQISLDISGIAWHEGFQVLSFAWTGASYGGNAFLALERAGRNPRNWGRFSL